MKMCQHYLLIFLDLISLISSTINHRVRTLHQVVNGTDANESEFPFIVSLQEILTNEHICGASLLSRIWVLTAAHCVANPERHVKNLRIEFGSTVLKLNESSNLMNVAEVFRHENFRFESHQSSFDIALLRLERPLEYTKNVQSVRLPFPYQEIPANTSAVLIGWGMNATDGQMQYQLQKATLNIFSHSECNRRFKKKREEQIICAGLPEGGKGQCNGDSGGPLMVGSVQVGIVSRSVKPCAVGPYPGIYTKISAHIHWIHKTIFDCDIKRAQ